MTPPTLLLIMNFKPRLHRPLEHWLLGLARGLAERGGRLHVVLSVDPVEWWAADFSAAGGAYTVVPEIREKWRFRPVLPVLKQVRPRALAFIFVPMGDPRTWLLARWPGSVRRRLYLDHNSWEVSAKSGLKQLLAKLRGRLTSAAFDGFISISEYNRRRNVERLYIDPRKSRVILNGVLDPADNTTVEPLPAQNEPYVFYVGQLMRDKGVHTLLLAWTRLVETGRTGGATLWLAGMGKEEEQMRALAAELRLTTGDQPAARFLGLRNDVPALMRGALANVIPSEWAEGFGLTAAEALAAGRPVVVSDAGALPEVVGDCGFIFPKGDAAALAGTLETAIAAGQAQDWDGAELQRRYQENFRLERMTAAYLEAFAEALELPAPK